MRLFVAIDPPVEVQEHVRPIQQRLMGTRAAVRWVEPGNFHITVKFIGEVDERLLPEIVGRVEAAARQVPTFPLRLEGVGRFPARGQPRVIMTPVLSPDQRITKLHRLIDSGMGGMGLAMDTRPLVPHLTLGRVASNHGLNKLLRLLPRYEFEDLGHFEAASVVVYQSTLSAEGSTYRALHRAAMKAKEDGTLA